MMYNIILCYNVYARTHTMCIISCDSVGNDVGQNIYLNAIYDDSALLLCVCRREVQRIRRRLHHESGVKAYYYINNNIIIVLRRRVTKVAVHIVYVVRIIL